MSGFDSAQSPGSMPLLPAWPSSVRRTRSIRRKPRLKRSVRLLRIAEINGATHRYQCALSTTLNTDVEQCAAAVILYRQALRRLCSEQDPVYQAVRGEPGLVMLQPNTDPDSIEHQLMETRRLENAFEQFTTTNAVKVAPFSVGGASSTSGQRRVPPPAHPHRAPWRRRNIRAGQ